MTRLRAVLTGPGLAAKDVTASSTTVAAPWLAGRQVTALRVARDGARVLVTSVRRGVSRIDVAGVVRDSHARPVSLTTPLQVGPGPERRRRRRVGGRHDRRGPGQVRR